MKLTYNHPSATSRRPVFVDEGGHLIDYGEGFKGLCKARGWTPAQLASLLGVSVATVYGWRQGRPPSDGALLQIFNHLRGRK